MYEKKCIIDKAVTFYILCKTTRLIYCDRANRPTVFFKDTQPIHLDTVNFTYLWQQQNAP